MLAEAFVDLLKNFGVSMGFAVVGIVALIIGYLAFDKVCPIDFNHQLGENKNIAVAIVVAGFLIGVAIIVAHVVA